MNETNLAKIAIRATADEALNVAIDRINKGFSGGRVTKTDVASWFITNSASSLDDVEIEKIRKANFNKVIFLEGLVRQLKADDRENLDPEETATILAMLDQKNVPKAVKKPKTSHDASPNQVKLEIT